MANTLFICDDIYSAAVSIQNGASADQGSKLFGQYAQADIQEYLNSPDGLDCAITALTSGVDYKDPSFKNKAQAALSAITSPFATSASGSSVIQDLGAKTKASDTFKQLPAEEQAAWSSLFGPATLPPAVPLSLEFVTKVCCGEYGCNLLSKGGYFVVFGKSCGGSKECPPGMAAPSERAPEDIYVTPSNIAEILKYTCMMCSPGKYSLGGTCQDTCPGGSVPAAGHWKEDDIKSLPGACVCPYHNGWRDDFCPEAPERSCDSGCHIYISGDLERCEDCV